MTATNNGDTTCTCAGVGGGWRRIANINISAGDDCPGEWRKATRSDVSFCRLASDGWDKCSFANFSTNGISYQRVCGRARGYQKGDTLAFYGSQPYYNRTIDQSLTVVILINIFGLTPVAVVKDLKIVLALVLLLQTPLFHMLAVTIIVNQLLVSK